MPQITRNRVSPERHAKLTKLGFIHVTGLMLMGTGALLGKEIGILGSIGVRGYDAKEKDLGTYAITQDRMMVIIALDRQIWIGRNDTIGLVAAEAPNGINEEWSIKSRLHFRQRDLLCRLADPNWIDDDS